MGTLKPAVKHKPQIAQPTTNAWHRLNRWLDANKPLAYELLIMAGLMTGTFIILFAGEFTESFYEFTRAHEDINLDEFVISFLVVMSIYLPIFSIRRWHESAHRLTQANTDSLTGLVNRRRGWELLELEASRATRHHRPLAIIIFDVDHFKKVNDQFGHLAGDRVLVGVAQVVLQNTRKLDTLLRWGGEEFMIICAETNMEGAHLLAQRLRAAIEAAHLLEAMPITASFGVAQWKPEDTLESFVKRADSRTYAAKAGGRNRIV